MSDTLTADPYAAPDWWLHVPSVDGIPDALDREFLIDDAGRAFLEHLNAELEARATMPDVELFRLSLVRQRKPACVRVKWRGVIVCSHSVPKLDAWAKSIGDAVLLWPLPGCGSYQTSTVASAGTHAGGGAIDLNGNGMSATTRAMVARKGREVGLQVDWFRGFIAGLWTNHFHAVDPDCPQLAKVAAAQCVECFNGGDGLVGTRPDPGWRGNIPQLRTVFDNRLYQAVSDIGTGIGEIAQTVADAARVRALQTVVRQPLTALWDIETDWPLAEIRTTALQAYTGAGFRSWSLAKRKAAQRLWGVTADGVWGPKTKTAARAIAVRVQRELGVPADGMWGWVTDKAYTDLRARRYRRFRFSRPTGTFPRPGQPGSLYGPSTPGRPWYSGASAGVLPKATIQWQIKRIQRMVGVGADGSYGPATTKAVKTWQARHRVTADGIVGPATWSAMVKANVS